MNKKPEYVRFATLTLTQGISLIQSEAERPMKGQRTEVMGHEVHLTSLRLRTFFYKGTWCSCCGVQATFFAIEKTRRSKLDIPHMNLYGVNGEGEEILFTKDHIVAKANGGRDVMENMQTMCRPCNNRKGCQ